MKIIIAIISPTWYSIHVVKYIKNKLINKLSNLGFELGCYDNALEKLSPYYQTKVLSSSYECWTDVKVKIDGRPYVVEISTVDTEKDFTLISANEYKNRYGNN